MVIQKTGNDFPVGQPEMRTPEPATTGSFLSKVWSTLTNKIGSVFQKSQSTDEIEMSDFASVKTKTEGPKIHVPSTKVVVPEKPVPVPDKAMTNQGNAVEVLAEKAAESVQNAEESPQKMVTVSRNKMQRSKKPPRLGISQEAPARLGGDGEIKEKLLSKRTAFEEPITAKEKSLSYSPGVTLTTAQTREAEGIAFETAVAIELTYAYQSTPITDGIKSPGEQSHLEDFLGVMKSIEQCIDEADLSSPNECSFLNGLVGLMHKGFNADEGGVGCFHHDKDNKIEWDSGWNHLGIGVDSFKADNPNNEELKGSVKKMLAFFRENASIHFDKSHHPGRRDLAAIQTMGTIGQLYQDFAFNKDFTPKIRNLLLNALQANGLTAKGGQSGEGVTPEVLDAYKNKVRSSPLLAEVANDTILDEIRNGLKTEKDAGEMIDLIERHLKKLDMENKLRPDELKDLATAVFDQFLVLVDNVKTQAFATGNRGRLPFNTKEFPKLGQAGTVLSTGGKKTSIAIAPNRAHDQLSDDTAKSVFKDDPHMQEFFAAVEGEEDMLKSGFAPRTALRLGEGLDKHFVKLTNPAELFREAISHVLEQQKGEGAEVEHKSEKISLLKQLTSDISTFKFASEFQNIIGKIEVTFNKATKQQIILEEFAQMSSVAGVMYNNDLRTICSISGTTVDITLSLLSTLGEEKLKSLLQPLIDHLNNKTPDPFKTPEGEAFKKLFTSITFFMQTGQYHTAGEVLGGLFIAARALTTSEEENINIKKTVQMFETLMRRFAANPSNYLAPPEELKEKIQEGRKQYIENWMEAEQENMRLRQEQLFHAHHTTRV